MMIILTLEEQQLISGSGDGNNGGTRKLTAALDMGLRLMVFNLILLLKIVGYFKIYQILVWLLLPLALLASLEHLLAEMVPDTTAMGSAASVSWVQRLLFTL